MTHNDAAISPSGAKHAKSATDHIAKYLRLCRMREICMGLADSAWSGFVCSWSILSDLIIAFVARRAASGRPQMNMHFCVRIVFNGRIFAQQKQTKSYLRWNSPVSHLCGSVRLIWLPKAYIMKSHCDRLSSPAVVHYKCWVWIVVASDLMRCWSDDAIKMWESPPQPRQRVRETLRFLFYYFFFFGQKADKQSHADDARGERHRFHGWFN